MKFSGFLAIFKFWILNTDSLFNGVNALLVLVVAVKSFTVSVLGLYTVDGMIRCLTILIKDQGQNMGLWVMLSWLWCG